jgi:cytochrome oxidase Cu insertion factor (SCO1/SenC/PrrC family)
MSPFPSAERSTRSRIATLSLVVLLIAVAAMSVAALRRAFGAKVAMAPDFTLTDQDDRPFTLSALRGHPVALFFGYTHCPDACPTTLAHLAQAVHSRGVPEDVRVAFITVDPDRDSPATLKRYVHIFDPSFIGLTGSLKTLNPIYSAYHTWREAVPSEALPFFKHGPKDYFMAHGTTIYYVGRDGSLKAFGQWDDPTTSIIHHLKEF